MTERPSLKLKLNLAKPPKTEPQDSPPLPPPSAPTPTAGKPLKIKFGKKSTSATPAPQAQDTSSQPTTTNTTKPKPARKPKPTPKKRALEEEPITSDDGEPLASKAAPGPVPKKLKLISGGAKRPFPPRSPSATETKQQIVHVKYKGKKPHRPKGVGYDSEAEDCEDDPVICESIILRMQPGDDCDYLRAAVAAGRIGPKKDGGADVRLRWLRTDGRRALVAIRGNNYAAILVDLPCVIEAMKSWFPKTGWMKSADICQMLMVLGRCKDEHEAREYPLPTRTKGEFDEKTWQWAHGLTPPMHWVRKRRFRKRISVRTVMEVEAEVDEMLRKDEKCIGEPIIEEIYDRPDVTSDDGGLTDDEEDAEGEFVDDTPITTIEDAAAAEDEEAAHARMAEEYEREMMLATSPSPPPNPNLDTTLPLNITSTPPAPTTSFDSPSQPAETSPSLAPTPTPTGAPASPPSSSGDSAEEEEADEEEMDEDQMERQAEMQKLKEDVRDLDELIAAEQGKLAQTANQLLRRRVLDKIRGLQQDRELKLAAAGQGGG